MTPSAHPMLKILFPRWTLGALGLLTLAGCANLPKENMFALGGVDPRSPVAADVTEASHSPGPYPKFNEIPPAPTDVRTPQAWKAAVLSEWSEKRQLEASAAAIPFTLGNTDTYADTTRGRISPELAAQAPADAEAQAKAFADAGHARATPPPKPN